MTTHCITVDGAVWAHRRTLEDARRDAVTHGAWHTAVGRDPVHPQLPNASRYRVESYVWDVASRKYILTATEVIEVERDRDKARAIVGI